MAIRRVTTVFRYIGLSTDALPDLLPENSGSYVFFADTEAYKVWDGVAWQDSMKAPW